MSFYVENSLLNDLELNTRKIHSHLIKGIAHNIMKDPSKIPEMKNKYLQYHKNTNTKSTLRPSKIDYEEDENLILKTILKNIETESSDESESDDNRCLAMVRVNRKIRQCKNEQHPDSEFCTYHEDDIIHPYGIKEINDEKEINKKGEKSIFSSDEED